MNWLEWLKQEWFKSEAISNYITCAASVFLALIGWVIVRIISRNRPSIIRVEKILETSLIDIHPRIKDELKFTYKDQPIDGFHEITFMIRNTGERPIEDIELIFAIEGLSSFDFLEVVFTSTERIEEFTVFNPLKPESDATAGLSESVPRVITDPLEYDPVALDPDAFTIYLPFLNPYKVYEDYLGVTIYASRPMVVKGVIGKGVGWTVKYVDKTVYYKKVINALGNTAPPIAYLTGKILDILIR